MNGKIFLVIAICLTILACEDDNLNPNVIDIKGITRTAANGLVLEVDTNDWKPKAEIKDIGFSPNPLMINSPGVLRFSLLTSSHIRIWAVNSKNETILTVFEGDMPAGNFSYSVEGLPVGYSRIYIQSDNDRTYGDVLMAEK